MLIFLVTKIFSGREDKYKVKSITKNKFEY